MLPLELLAYLTSLPFQNFLAQLCPMGASRGGSSIKSDRIQKLDAEGVREWRSHEPLGGSGGMLPQKILKTRTPQMLFPAFWRVNFKQKSTAKMSKKIAKLVIYSHYFLMLGIKFHIQLIYSACQTLCMW